MFMPGGGGNCGELRVGECLMWLGSWEVHLAYLGFHPVMHFLDVPFLTVSQTASFYVQLK